MWELIRANQQKSVILFVGMALCLLGLGYAIGAAIEPNVGSFYGLSAAGVIWILLSLISYFSGDSILLSGSNATEATHEIHPQLFNVVEEMKIAANLPKIPKVYIIDEDQPNAFATGRNSDHASVAVTTGLLSRLNRDELQGVVAHEVSHILNRDILYMTCAGVMLGSVSMISEIFLRGFRGGSHRRYRSSGRGGGQGQAVMILIAIVFAVLAPFLARILYFSLSRKREYLADASGVRLTRYPEGLASALEKISGAGAPSVTANEITAPMYIVNPLHALDTDSVSLWSTHPATSERIRILRSMIHGVNFLNYEDAFKSVKGKTNSVLPQSARADLAAISIRERSAEEREVQRRSLHNESLNQKVSVRQVRDLKRAVNQFAFVSCACGLRFKLPPDFHKQSVVCPKCFSQVRIPEMNNAAKTEPLSYKRTVMGWESFKCVCGRLTQLSPNFLGTKVDCQDCGRTITIEPLVSKN